MNKTEAIGSDILEKLKANLANQSKVFQTCLSLSRAQRQALVQNRLEENQEINKRMEKLAEELSGLEIQRQQILKKFQTHIYGDMRPELKLDDLIAYAPVELQDELKTVQTVLKDNIEQLKNVFGTNAALIQNARKMNQASITLLTGLSDSDIGKQREVYGSNGYKNRNTQQKRSLYNKKV